MNKPFKISLSEPYLHDFPNWFKKAAPTRWLIDLAGERDLVMVECVYLHDLDTVRNYLADQVTGSLYNLDSGACLSSSRLHLIKPVASVAPYKPVPMTVVA